MKNSRCLRVKSCGDFQDFFRRGSLYLQFTLIELLITIGMIAILVALLLPGLEAAREKAKGVYCLGNMKQLGTSVLSYADDFKQYIPSYTSMGNSGRWQDIFADYAGLRKAKIGAFQPAQNVFRCPCMPDGVYFGTSVNQYMRTSYSTNAVLANSRLRFFKRPSAVALVVEGRGFHSVYPASSPEDLTSVSFYHSRGTGCNVAFSDGAATFRKKTTVPCYEVFPDVIVATSRARGTWFWDDASDAVKRCGDL
ncbi:MAG: hypothetical protein ACI4UV_08720 [Victivallales bacterium]